MVRSITCTCVVRVEENACVVEEYVRRHQLSVGLGQLRFWQRKRQLAPKICSCRTEGTKADVRHVIEQALFYTHQVQFTACMLSGRTKPFAQMFFVLRTWADTG